MEPTDPIPLLTELRDSARAAAKAEAGERHAILLRRRELRERLADLPRDSATAAAVSEHLALVGPRLERLDSETSGAEGASVEILELRGDLSWIPLVLREDSREESLVALEAELETVGAATEELVLEGEQAPARALAAVEEGLKGVRGALLAAEVDRLTTVEDPDLGELWAAYLAALDESEPKLASELRTRIKERVAESEVRRVGPQLARLSAEYEDRTLDLLASQAELEPAAAAEGLDGGRREMAWLRVLQRATIRRCPRDRPGSKKLLTRANRRLGKATRRLWREGQELRLLARLEGIFGRRFVTFFENLILWLILAVLVIITVDFLLPRPESFESHLGFVNSAAFSPKGEFVVTASEAGIARVYEAESGEETLAIEGHTAAVRSAVCSPDGGALLTASDDRTARIWDAETGRELTRLTGHRWPVRAAAYSPDGSLVVTASSDATARLWSAASGVEILRFEAHRGPVLDAGFSPDGLLALTASQDGTARMWETESGREVRLLDHAGQPVRSAKFSPDGALVLTAANDGITRIWDSRTGEEIRRFGGDEGMVFDVAFAPGGDRCLTACEDHGARLWDPATGKLLRVYIGHAAPVRSVAFAPDGGLVLTASDDHSARLWDPKSGREIRRGEGWRKVRLFLFWGDALICLVFLVEFFTKLALVRGKLSWFGRHFLVDFVPSIPFGLIAALTLESMRAGKIAVDQLRVVRLVRIARMSRILRYVRIARPAFRFVRFFGFLQRGLDRLVRLHGNLLNRSIVVFEPESLDADEGKRELSDRLRSRRNQSREVWRRVSGELEPPLRAERLTWFLEGLPRGDRLLALPPDRPKGQTQVRKLLRAEDLVERLTQLDPGTVEAELGTSGAVRIVATLERLDVPLLRRIPGLKQMIPAAREGEPLERVTAAGRALGRYLQKLLAVVHWVSDLSGVITGPQFLDRLGTTLVQATARPAKRLLLFGIGFLVLHAMTDLMGLAILSGIARWLDRTLGTAFLILGAGCLVGLVLGTWFRRIAGEATDFYTRTAEAQYINLLKAAKLSHVDEDVEVLWDRVLRPEGLLRGDIPVDGAARLRRGFEKGRAAPGSLGREDRVLQLYHDYLDGAIFHISDTKTTSQLLGNLALENIRTERLGTSRREWKRLRSLDLDRERSGIRGPYIWFRSVTHSVAQQTAKRILEYNRHAIPLAERGDYPEHVVQAFERWADSKIRGEKPKRGESDAVTAFVTTEFSALHFLTAEEDRDRDIEERFGKRTLKALQADRQAMIRTIFGTYPFHRLPRPDRTLNPFELYSRHLAGGRVLLLPWYLVQGVAFVLGWLIRRVRETVREILNPDLVEGDSAGNWAEYDVAVRKINRMRKPLFMECARFRAMFDPEYLGLALLADEDSGVEGRTFREDLERIAARDEEWDAFFEVRQARDEALHEINQEVRKAGGPKEYLESLGEGVGAGDDLREMHRAVAIAYSIDYRGTRTLARLRTRSREIMKAVIESEGKVCRPGLGRRLVWLLIPSRELGRSFEEFLLRFGPPELTAKQRKWLWHAVRSDHEGLARLVRGGAGLDPGTDPFAASRAILRDVARHSDTWSEQLVTLRAVQSLSVLDVRNYRRQVWALGGYGNE